MQAFAAEHAAEAAQHGAQHSEGLLHDPAFWVALAFVVLVILIGKKIYLMAANALDDRSEAIRARLDEAAKLREEAQELLASNKRQQAEAAEEAKRMIEKAKEEADRVRERMIAEMERDLKRRQELAEQRIAQVEAAAMDEVREIATDVALKAAEAVLTESLTKAKSSALIDAAIKELPEKFH